MLIFGTKWRKKTILKKMRNNTVQEKMKTKE